MIKAMKDALGDALDDSTIRALEVSAIMEKVRKINHVFAMSIQISNLATCFLFEVVFGKFLNHVFQIGS